MGGKVIQSLLKNNHNAYSLVFYINKNIGGTIKSQNSLKYTQLVLLPDSLSDHKVRNMDYIIGMMCI